MKILILFSFLFASSFSANARVLVYEYGVEGDGDDHGIIVTQIACRELDTVCETFYSKELSHEDLLDVEESLRPGDVVNMSFAFQRPEQPSSGPFTRRYTGADEGKDPQLVYREALDEFKESKEQFERVVSQNPETLFVAAAGNGFMMMGMSTPGVPLSNYKVFPAFINMDNLIKVSSLDDVLVDTSVRTDYRIMDYANYDVMLVDIAAPVELSDEGESLRGTSFAAPFVSRISKQIIKNFDLNPIEIRSVLWKSAFIENLDKTIELTNEYINNETESVIYRIINEGNRRKREAMRAENPDVMMVKSGGALVSKVALQCSENYAAAKGVMTITEACLMAHESELSANKTRQQKLLNMWTLRNIL